MYRVSSEVHSGQFSNEQGAFSDRKNNDTFVDPFGNPIEIKENGVTSRHFQSPQPQTRKLWTPTITSGTNYIGVTNGKYSKKYRDQLNFWK